MVSNPTYTNKILNSIGVFDEVLYIVLSWEEGCDEATVSRKSRKIQRILPYKYDYLIIYIVLREYLISMLP